MSSTPTYVRSDNFLKTKPSRVRQPSSNNEIADNTQPSGGSREHYFHFLLGYLLPLIHEQEKRQLSSFQVLECGPLMTPILNKTLSLLGYNFETIENEAIEEPIYLEKWDYEWRCHDAAEKTIEKIKSAWSAEPCCKDLESENLLLVRSQPSSYYVNGGAEIKGYGTSRREITNWREIRDYLAAHGIQIAAYEPGSHSLGCQMRTFQRAKKIVGIRGAEWANVVWCNELDALIFDPRPPATTLLSLLKRKRITYQFHYIDQEKCVVDPRLIYDYLSRRV
ncbi:glycosyltransferase 61 family protein [Ectopseudomonas guguanensis]|jgi:hypothetical protein|uniref:Glycosyltransferase 61 catalytic domain-containing protein n=1 Tax=Ectopseudomonas guguanensis TaxID=1198456 RepID=A0A1H0TNI5_9GAMM|nr:glycosyltransferase 61 family protein [Pseudomonas guguanensis]SDP55116.1 Protein of unknown function [Pseudomonas guguanensis]